MGWVGWPAGGGARREAQGLRTVWQMNTGLSAFQSPAMRNTHNKLHCQLNPQSSCIPIIYRLDAWNFMRLLTASKFVKQF